jgi:hypothetical protein
MFTTKLRCVALVAILGLLTVSTASPASAERPDFEGQMTLTTYVGGTGGPRVVGTLTGYQKLDLGYTTMRTQRRYSSTGASYSYAGLTFACKKTNDASCGWKSLGSSPPNSSFKEAYFYFNTNPPPSSGSFVVTLTGTSTVGPSTGSIAGRTPAFKCYSSTQQCKWQ